MLIKLLLSPLALLYGLIVSLRLQLYRWKILRSTAFDLPVISVGNLSAGGTGKTPHIEYLIRLLKEHIPVGVLSRGYMRKTSGFHIVESNETATSAGDEPLLLKKKHPDITVAVGESRIEGIPLMLAKHPEIKTILLDDAYQHLGLTPGLNILLTEYNDPFTKDYLLPAGRLREWRSGYERADIIIVTKCPVELKPADKAKMIAEISPLPHQRIYFSYYEYGTPYAPFQQGASLSLSQELDVFLVCGIAKTDYMTDYLVDQVGVLKYLEFEDHHFFSNHDIGRVMAIFKNIESANKIILTTEKDAVRFQLHRQYIHQTKMPLFVLPIRVRFHDGDGSLFDEDIRNFLLNFIV